MSFKHLLSFLGTALLAFFVFTTETEAATYEVKQGDTISTIAQAHGTTVAKLKTTNNLRSNTITAGQTVTVPTVIKKVEKADNTVATKEEPKFKTIKVRATAYTAYCAGCSGITATGINLKKNKNLKVIAVDPRVIPLGSKVWVEGYGDAIAGDTGGAIKGNRIDVFFPQKKQATNWGRRTVTIKVYE